jgi:acyl-coenzyme A thioesterase PaaI-like protein
MSEQGRMTAQDRAEQDRATAERVRAMGEKARGSSEPNRRTGKVVMMPHNCFACGTTNLHGLQLDLNFDGETCWTELRLRPDFEGWQGIAHGGIVTTLLDEVMAWAIAAYNVWAVTAKMTVEFRDAVQVGTLIRAEGRVLENRRRAYTTEATLTDVDSGKLLAKASALFVPVTGEGMQQRNERFQWKVMPEGLELEGAAAAETMTATEAAHTADAGENGRSAE